MSRQRNMSVTRFLRLPVLLFGSDLFFVTPVQLCPKIEVPQSPHPHDSQHRRVVQTSCSLGPIHSCHIDAITQSKHYHGISNVDCFRVVFHKNLFTYVFNKH